MILFKVRKTSTEIILYALYYTSSLSLRNTSKAIQLLEKDGEESCCCVKTGLEIRFKMSLLS
jgi:hypothetical protein